MRSDMAKVIVERPRLGGGMPFPLRARPDCARLEIDEWRRRQGLRRPWLKRAAKGLNENLAPLRRYLRSQVGRPWNKVYSEICERINRNSAVQLHIWQHLMQYVCTDPYVASNLIGRRLRHYDFIVDPKTGLLRENRVRWPRSTAKSDGSNPDRVRVNQKLEYRRIEGVWYKLQLAAVPAFRIGYDFAMKKDLAELSDESLRKLYGAGVYAAGKRQLNKREIRRLGLNDPRKEL